MARGQGHQVSRLTSLSELSGGEGTAFLSYCPQMIFLGTPTCTGLQISAQDCTARKWPGQDQNPSETMAITTAAPPLSLVQEGGDDPFM